MYPILAISTDLQQQLLTLVTAAWLGCVGACVGSFLNVVAYRMPIGASIVWIPSRCPSCGFSIRLRDNIPIVGWLMLRGRCRDCGVKISPRYWLVEAAMAGAFVLLAYFELFTGGANLPGGPVTVYTGAWGTFWHPEWELIGVYFYHCAILAVLLTMVLIDLDGRQIPWSLVAFGIGLSLLVKFMSPLAHISEGAQLVEGLRDRPIASSLSGVLAGAIFVTLFAGMIRFLSSAIFRTSLGSPAEVIQKLYLDWKTIFVGATCGSLIGLSSATWLAIMPLWFILWLVQLSPFNPPRSSLRTSALFGLWPVTLVLILWWKPLADFFEPTIVKS